VLVVVLLASYGLGRIHRVKAKPLRGRFASLDPVPPAKGWQLRGGRSGPVVANDRSRVPIAGWHRGICRAASTDGSDMRGQ
jgi:hypothetical protein